MAEIRLAGVTKLFGGVTAVDDVSLQIADGEFLFLVVRRAAASRRCCG